MLLKPVIVDKNEPMIPDFSDLDETTFWGSYTIKCAIDRAKRFNK